MVKGVNYYNELGVPVDATPEEVRIAYFEAARRLHPDTNPSPQAANQFIRVKDAYEVLSHPDKRKRYDEDLSPGDLKPPAISLNILYSRSSLPYLAEQQLMYVFLELISVPEIEKVVEIPPLNLCLLIDRSTSMQGARMDTVKANAIQLFRQMKPTDVISVVTFSDWAEVLIPATCVADLDRIENKLNQIHTSGGTEIFHGLEAGLSQVRKYASSSYINHMILLTDGRTYGDESQCIHLAEVAANEGVGLSGLGIGHEWNDIFLDQLVSYSGGSSMYVSAPRDLKNFLEEKFSNLERVYAKGVSLKFDLPENVELRFAFRIQPEAGMLSTASPIRVGNLIQSKNLTLVLEFLLRNISGQSPEQILAKGNIIMDIPTRTVPMVRIPMTLKRPITQITEPEAPHPLLVEALSRITLYRMQDRARSEVAAGDIPKATKHLQYLATHLLAQGERELAHTVLVEAEHIQHTAGFSKEGDKRIKYGTRALLLPPGPEIKKYDPLP